MRYFRDDLGRFARHSGRYDLFSPTGEMEIVPGRLYDYRGTTVRAGQTCRNGLRHVQIHKMVHGFVPDWELGFIDKSRVEQYLERA